MEERTTLLSKISQINSDILTCTESEITEALLFGDNLFNQFDNNRILNTAITLYFHRNDLMIIFSILIKVQENGQQIIWITSYEILL